MKIQIKEYKKYRAGEILPLYEAAEWHNYTDRPEMLANAYTSSLRILAAYDGEKLVGIIRAVGDGASVVLVQDLIVLPEYRRRGIGTKLVGTLFSLYRGCYQKLLFTDASPVTEHFYRSVGLYPVEEFGCKAYFRTY